MARLFSSGFELQSMDDGVEFYANDAVNLGSVQADPVISTSIKHGGAASMRCNLSSNDIKGVIQKYGSDDVIYSRFYLYIPSGGAPNTNNNQIWIAAYNDDSNQFIEVISLRLNTDRTLQVTSPGQNHASIGSASSALAEDTWHRIEIFFNVTTTNWHVTARVNGTDFVDTDHDGSSVGSGDLTALFFGARATTGTMSCDLYFDDIAINDASGSFQNSWPGEGKIVHALPNSAGDNNAWLKQGGGAGDTNNYQSVDEVTPDDAATYLKRTSGQPIDDYNVQSSSDVGIGASDTITLVAVGARVGATSNTANSARELTYRIKGQSGGTLQTQADNTCNVNGWATHRVAIPRNYRLTAYVNPQDSAAWEPSDIDNMQIGVQPDTSSTTEVRVSAIWALIEYVTSGVSIETKTFTVDGLVKEINTATFTVDGIVLAQTDKTFTVDGVVLATTDKTFTVDGIVLVITDKTFTVDGVVLAQTDETFTADGIVKAQTEETFTVDGVIFATNTHSFTADGIVQATLEETFTVDGIVLVVTEETFTVDGLVLAITDKTFTIDGIVFAVNTQTFTADAIVFATNTNSFTADGIVLEQFTDTFTVDGIVLVVTDKTFTADGVVLAVTEATFTVDGVVFATNTFTFTADGIVSEVFTNTFTVDGIIFATNTSAFTADGIVKATYYVYPSPFISETFASTPSGTLKNNAAYVTNGQEKYVRLTQATGGQNGELEYTGTLPSHFDVGFDIQALNGSGSPADSIWFYWGSSTTPTSEENAEGGYLVAFDEYVGDNGGNTVQLTFQGVQLELESAGVNLSDGTRRTARIEVRGLTIRVYLDGVQVLTFTDTERSLGGDLYGVGARTGGEYNEHRVYNLYVNGTFTVDGVVLALTTNTFTVDGIVFATNTTTFTVDGVILVQTDETFTVDGIVLDLTEVTFTADGVVFATNTNSFTADGIVFATNDFTFTVDAIVFAVNEYSFTADGIVQATQEFTFAVDGLINAAGIYIFEVDGIVKEINEATFTVDGVVRETQSESFTADAIVKEVNIEQFTVDGIVKVITQATLTADGVVKEIKSEQFTIDGIVLEQFEETFTADGVVKAKDIQTFTTDGIVRETFEEEFTADGVIKALTEATFTVDARIVGSFDFTFTVDGLIANLKTFSADALIKEIIGIVLEVDGIVESPRAGHLGRGKGEHRPSVYADKEADSTYHGRAGSKYRDGAGMGLYGGGDERRGGL